MDATNKIPCLKTCRELWDAGLRLETERVWDLRVTPSTGEAEWHISFSWESSGEYQVPAPDLAELFLVTPFNWSEKDGVDTAEDAALELLDKIERTVITPATVNERTKGD